MSGKEVIAEVVGRTLDTAKDNPDMRAAGSALGASLRIVAETVRTALLPLAVANLGVRKFEEYIRGKFADELDNATATIPEESLQEPPLSIAGPVMQGLAYTYESEELRRMYLALLATSMDSARDTTAHPAFADVIRQLDPREAVILGAIMRAPGGVGAVRYSKRISPLSTLPIQDHVLPIWADTSRLGALSWSQLAAYVENWSRLGLVAIDYARQFASAERYGWVDEWPTTVRWKEMHGDDLMIERGSLTLTTWGEQFARALRLGDEQDDIVHVNSLPDEPDDEDSAALGPEVIDGGSP
ncbi:DUF4393 domain-containing protein [Microbacterium plantarum]|uniref:DUF4393 domain-containing protein n=1 Tax=Microbacterium plantarum TaxID=1816425 RepID=A0ABV5EST5_9MICO